MSAFANRTRAALWWLVPLAVFVALIGFESGWGTAFHRTPSPEPPAAPKPVVLALMPEYAIAGGVAARTETVTRTLFNPTRRQAAQLSASKQLMQRGQFALTGTTLIEGKSTAFLREITGGKSRRVQQGETINGLTVAEVKPDRVKLALGDETEELVLSVGKNPRPTVQLPVPAAPHVVGMTPVTAQPPVPTPQPNAAQQASDAAQSLAQRRAAARAAAAAANGQAQPPSGSAAVPVPTPAPGTPAAAQPNSAAPAQDPRWLELYRSYEQRRAVGSK